MHCHFIDRWLRVGVVLAVIVAPTGGEALTLVAPPQRDNTLYESTLGDVSNGAGQHFFAGTTATGLRRRGVVAFDVPAGIAPGTQVDSAAVVLFMSRTQLGTHGVSLHRLLADWGEGTSDAALEEGGGTASTPGDATWVHRSYDTVTWAAQGGDFVAGASAATSVGGVGEYVWSSPALLDDVQAWVDDPESNFGWLLRGDEGLPATAKRFDTRENPDPARRPRLLLFFHTPTDVAGGAIPFRLHPGAPNPFRVQTTVRYDLASAQPAVLRLLDARGRQLRSFHPAATPGAHFLTWRGDDSAGRPLPAGKYFLVLESGGARRVQGLVVAR